MIDIQKEIKELTFQIIEKYKPEKIILFGSAARGEFTPDSDLDFLIVKKDTPYYGIDRMREIDNLITTKVAADFLVYRPDEIENRIKMGDPFIKVIFKEGKVLYG
ncbi:MAG: nucleotidyltransferase domain-containing protein [Deltaproteobacteria bacterium]|nr:nucleotidyltransferase domain-containing protein [Deltaproteobacteria bacterium]